MVLWRRSSAALVAACVAVGVTFTTAARADGSDTQPAATAGAPADAGPKTLEPRFEPLYIGLDTVIGFGDFAAVERQLPETGQVDPTYALVNANIRTATFTLMAHYDFKKFGIGARLPLIAGVVRDYGGPITGQSIFSNGGLELSMDMPKKVSESVRYLPELALVVPLAPGTAPPPHEELAGKVYDPGTANAYDRYAVGLAAAYAHGGEDDALYLNWRLGVVPKAELDLKFNHTKIEPYVKIPIMISMQGDSPEPFRLEAVGAVRVAQEIGPVDVGVRLVGNLPIAAMSTMRDPLFAVEPEVRLHITPSSELWVGGVMVLGGSQTIYDKGDAGAFQIGLSATF